MLFTKYIAINNLDRLNQKNISGLIDKILKRGGKRAVFLLVAGNYDDFLEKFPKPEIKVQKESIYFWKSSLFVVFLPFLLQYFLQSDKIRNFVNSPDDYFSCVDLQGLSEDSMTPSELENLYYNRTNCLSASYYSIFAPTTKDGSLDILSSAPFICFPVMVLEAVICLSLYFFIFKSHKDSFYSFEINKSKETHLVYCLNRFCDLKRFIGRDRILFLPKYIDEFTQEDKDLWSIFTTYLSDGVPKMDNYFNFLLFRKTENDFFRRLQKARNLVITASKDHFDKLRLTRGNTGREEVFYFDRNLYRNKDVKKIFPNLNLRPNPLLKLLFLSEDLSIIDEDIKEELLNNDNLSLVSDLITAKTNLFISSFLGNQNFFFNDYIKKIDQAIYKNKSFLQVVISSEYTNNTLDDNNNELKLFLTFLSKISFDDFVLNYQDNIMKFKKLNLNLVAFQNLKLNQKEEAIKNIFLHIDLNDFVSNVLLSIYNCRLTTVYGPPGTGKTTLIKNIMKLLSSTSLKSVVILDNGDIIYKTSKPPIFKSKWFFIAFNRLLESIHLLGLLYLYVCWHLERNKAVSISQNTKVFYGEVPIKQIDPSDTEAQISDILRELSLPLILFSGAICPRLATLYMKYNMDQSYFSRNITFPFFSQLVYEEFKSFDDFILPKIEQALLSCKILFIENWEELSSEEKSKIIFAINYKDDGIYVFYKGNYQKTNCEKIIICSNNINEMQVSNMENKSDKINYVNASSFGYYNLNDSLLKFQLKNQIKANISDKILDVFADYYIIMCEVLSELFSKDSKLLFLVRDPFREIDRLLLLNSINSSEDMMKACEKSFLFNLNMLLRIKNGVDTNLLPFNNQGLYSSNINTYKLKKKEKVLRI